MKVVYSIVAGALLVATYGCGDARNSWLGVRSGNEEPILLSATKVFVPKGFDDNDQVQVVIDGWLNNSCESATTAKVNINHETREVEVLPMGVRKEGVCAQMRRRFNLTAAIGILPAADYRVYANDRMMDESLSVAESNSSGPDDFSYAEIDRVTVDYAPDRNDALMDSRWSVILEGRLTSTCQKLKEIRVVDSSDTIEVLPITSDNGTECRPISSSFVERAFLPDYTTPGRYLIHVRSANGQAVNQVFSAFDAE
jgi:hypothetical protein